MKQFEFEFDAATYTVCKGTTNDVAQQCTCAKPTSVGHNTRLNTDVSSFQVPQRRTRPSCATCNSILIRTLCAGSIQEGTTVCA